MEVRYCSCGTIIPSERLEVFPHTSYCVSCSDKNTPDRIGFMSYECKTNPVLVLVDSRDKEGLRRAIRSDRRSR